MWQELSTEALVLLEALWLHTNDRTPEQERALAEAQGELAIRAKMLG